MTDLKDKRIALIGGIGARGESRQKLIEELGLAELEWVYSEKGKTREFEIFFDSLRPGKYDYVFILTKFISHKVYTLLKKSNTQGTPIIKVNGSYNSESFLNALLTQTPIKVDEQPTEQVQPIVFKKFLKLDSTHELESAPITTPEPIVKSDDEATRWRELFKYSTPEEAFKRINAKIENLESRVAHLGANQLDTELVKAANRYHLAVAKYLSGTPKPVEIIECGQQLNKALLKHSDVLGKEAVHIVYEKNVTNESIMRSYLLLTKLFDSSYEILKIIYSRKMYDRFGACLYCRMHKSKGCSPSCHTELMKKYMDHFDTSLNAAHVGVKLPY